MAAIQTTLAVDTKYKRASIQNRTSELFTLTGRGGSEVCHDVVVDIEVIINILIEIKIVILQT